MKRRFAGTMMGLALAGGLPVGCETAPDSLAHEVMSREDRTLAEEVTQQNATYWAQRELGATAIPRLVLLSGSDTFVCKRPNGVSELTAEAQTQYCPDEDTIVVTAMSVNAQNAIGNGKLGIIFSLSHEYGHYIQDAKDELDPLFHDKAAKERLELQASCYSGASMSDRYDSVTIDNVADNLRTNPLGAGYGTSGQQADQFLAGAHTGNC
jgi:hypothetical protein